MIGRVALSWVWRELELVFVVVFSENESSYLELHLLGDSFYSCFLSCGWRLERENTRLSMFCLQLVFVDCKHMNGRFIPRAEEPEQCPISWAERRRVLKHVTECRQSHWRGFRSTLSQERWRARWTRPAFRNGKHDGPAEFSRLSCHFGSKFLSSQFLFSPKYDDSEQMKMRSTSSVPTNSITVSCLRFSACSINCWVKNSKDVVGATRSKPRPY